MQDEPNEQDERSEPIPIGGAWTHSEPARWSSMQDTRPLATTWRIRSSVQQRPSFRGSG
jgi:hypothetical protein